MYIIGKNDGKNLSDDLTNNEKRVLLELINNPSIPYDTLVLELKISRRTISRVFVSLVEKGYIESKPALEYIYKRAFFVYDTIILWFVFFKNNIPFYSSVHSIYRY